MAITFILSKTKDKKKESGKQQLILVLYDFNLV